jgi:hypothetical protein
MKIKSPDPVGQMNERASFNRSHVLIDLAGVNPLILPCGAIESSPRHGSISERPIGWQMMAARTFK